MGKITLKKALYKMCAGNEKLLTFKYFIKCSLRNTESGNIILREGDVVEIQDGVITISFTWDMISVVNNITHKYADLIYPEKIFEVFD